MREVDVLVIGGGPAGLTAAMYAAYARLSTVVIERQAMGGKMTTTDVIDNYPGFPEGIKGGELSDRMHAQAARFGCVLAPGAIETVRKTGRYFEARGSAGEFRAVAVVLASGSEPRRLDCPGEKEFSGRGVSYCAVCDAHFYKGLKVAVVGGGNSAVEEAIYLTRFADSVTLIHRRDSLRAAEIVQKDLFGNPKIHVAWDSVVAEVRGDTGVKSLSVNNIKTNVVTNLACDGVFISVGFIAHTSFVRDLVDLDEGGFIKTDAHMMTRLPGLFAAGDVRSCEVKQVGNAVGDGTIAGVMAERYVAAEKRKS